MPTDVAAVLAAKATAQSQNKRFAVTLLLACLALCLGNVAAVLSSPAIAQAVELIGQY